MSVFCSRFYELFSFALHLNIFFFFLFFLNIALFTICSTRFPCLSFLLNVILIAR